MARVATVNSANTLDKLYGTAVPPAAPTGGAEFYTSTPGAPVAPVTPSNGAPPPGTTPLTANQTAGINSGLVSSGQKTPIVLQGPTVQPGQTASQAWQQAETAANDAQSKRSGGVLGDVGRLAAAGLGLPANVAGGLIGDNLVGQSVKLVGNPLGVVANLLPNGSGLTNGNAATQIGIPPTPPNYLANNPGFNGSAAVASGVGNSRTQTGAGTPVDSSAVTQALAGIRAAGQGGGGTGSGMALSTPQIAPTSAATVGQLAAGQQVQAARAAQVAGLGSANLMNAPTAAQQQIAAAPTAAQQQIAAIQNAAFNPAAFNLREYSEDTTNPDNALALLKAATESASAQNIGNAAMARGGPAAVALAQREARGANAAAYSDLAGQTAQIQLQEDEARRARIAQAYNTNQGVLSDVYGLQQNIGANQALANLNARTNQNVAQLGSNTQVALGNANNATSQNVAQLGSNTQVALGNANNQNQAQISYQQTQAQRDIANQQAQVSQANLNAQLAQQASLANQSDSQARALAQLASQTQTGIANAGNASQQAIAQAQLAATTQGQQLQAQTAQLQSQMQGAIAAGDIASQQYIAQLQAQNNLDKLNLQKQLGIGVAVEPSSLEKGLGAAKDVTQILALLAKSTPQGQAAQTGLDLFNSQQ